AAVRAVVDVVHGPGPYPGARLSDPRATRRTYAVGDAVALGFNAVPLQEVPDSARAARKPVRHRGVISGIAWLDFRPGGGRIWAGFAMVIIGAGLAAIPREVLEAARVDGASEWDVFRRVTVPLLGPVIAVVLVTLLVNVLKVFDLVYVLPLSSTQPDASVIAL